jgi:hypothetical protein
MPCIPPVNTDWTTAIDLTPSDAGTLNSNMCFPGPVWFKWTTGNGTGLFQIEDSPFAPTIDVYTDPLGVPIQSGNAFGLFISMEIGVTYYIKVTSRDVSNPFTIDWTFTPCYPANDDFVNADTMVGDSGSIAGDTSCATLEASEPTTGAKNTDTVWYKWTAPFRGTLTLTIDSGGDVINVESFTGLAVYALTGPTASMETSDPTTELAVSVIGGETYYIRIYHSDVDTEGTFTLFWSFVNTPSPPIPIASQPKPQLLGCSQHVAYIQDKCNGPRLCELLDISDLQYDRRLDDISEASVTIPISGDSDDPCCSCLANVWPWCHQLTIVRELDGVVWTGPITKITYGYNSVKIEAKDHMAWLQKRVNEIPVIWAYPNTTVQLTTMAKTIAETAMADDDSPCLLDNILDLGDGFPAGSDRSVGNGIPNSSDTTHVGFEAFGGPTAYDDIVTLANAGMDFTVVNQAIIFQSEKLPDTAIGILTDELILGEIEVARDGALAANRIYVRYDGDDDCAGVCTPQGSPTCPCPGFEEGAQECFGLLEMVVPDSSGGAVNLDSSRVVAQTYLNASRIVPLTVEFAGDTRLSPDCPWRFNSMIPGQRLDVALSKLCVPVYQGFKIQQVTVTDGGDGEAISISLKAQSTS